MADDDSLALLRLLNTKETITLAGRTVPIVNLPPFNPGLLAAAIAGSILGQLARSVIALPRAFVSASLRLIGGMTGFITELLTVPIETAESAIRVTFDLRIGPLRGSFDQFGLLAVIAVTVVSLLFIAIIMGGIREALERLLGVS